MSDQDEILDEDSIEEALRLGGWLLAGQASIAARGEVPMPRVIFAPSHILVEPRMDKSEEYHDHIRVARVMIAEQEKQNQRWAFVYDVDLEDSGRILIGEVVVGASRVIITFGQRYTFSAELGLQLVGDFQIVGQEFLRRAVCKKLESCRWRDLLAEGAAHGSEGGQWPAWPSAEQEGIRLTVDEFGFAVPEGWIFRQASNVKGWVIARLVPWGRWGREPVMSVWAVEYPNVATLEGVMNEKRKELIGRGCEILTAEISRDAPSLSSGLGRIAWRNGGEDRFFSVDCWVPADSPGRFLLLMAVSFDEESWEDLLEALESVLDSLDVSPRRSRRDHWEM